MTSAVQPQLWIIAGPNGAGKTTLAKRWIGDRIPVVNPDDIAARLPRKDGKLDERTAGELALAQRKHLLTKRQTFAIESTLSGNSALKLMHQASAAGYKSNLVFVGVDDPAVCLARVVDRVRAGGHDVPPEAIVRRFDDALKNLGVAFRIANRTIVFDNSKTRRRLVLLHEDNQARFIAKAVPEWARRSLPDVAWPLTHTQIPLSLIAHRARDCGR